MTYPAIKSHAIKEAEAIKIVGKENVDAVKKINCDFSNRLIDDVFDVVEFSASIDCADLNGEDCTLTILYLVDKESLEDCDDLGTLDWDRYTFTID